jgi:hypothetical protein
MKTLKEEDKPVLDDKTISQIVVDTLVGATKKSDTKNRLADALKTTPVSPKKIADALAPSKITGSQSTTTSKSTKGTTGTKPAGSKPQSTTNNNDSNKTESNVSETIYNKGKNMSDQIDEQTTSPALSSAGKKVESKLEKIPGLEGLLAAVRDKGNAADILLQVAEGLGGDKLKASVALKTALNLALQKEKEPKPDATTPEALKEFVSYLFEGTER